MPKAQYLCTYDVEGKAKMNRRKESGKIFLQGVKRDENEERVQTSASVRIEKVSEGCCAEDILN